MGENCSEKWRGGGREGVLSGEEVELTWRDIEGDRAEDISGR